jgi:hypothetical protein
MITRHSRMHAVGLLAGLSVVSSSVLSMFLATSGPVQAANPCASSGTSTGTAAAGARGSQIHLTAFTAQGAGKGTSSSSPSPSASPIPTVVPGSPVATVSPSSQPKGTSSPSPVGSPQPSPIKTVTPTPSRSPSPSPTPTKSSPPPPTGHLCLSLQSLKGSTVSPGTHARYAIWVWLTSGSNGSAKISLVAKPQRMTPVFTVCQPAGGSSCKVAGLAAGQRVELQARIAVPKQSKATRVVLSVTGTSPDAVSSASASITVQVQAKPTPSPTPTPTGGGGNPGDGGTLPGAVPPPGSYPSVSIPGLPSPAGNVGSAFPQVLPSPQPSPNTVPHADAIRATDVSAGLPLNVRLIGGQLVGLAILAAAITIAVARLSLRGTRPSRRTDDKATPGAS